jgi:hypothetical protein
MIDGAPNHTLDSRRALRDSLPGSKLGPPEGDVTMPFRALLASGQITQRKADG